MSDARSLLDEMRVSQAQHLPLVAAFLERMGLAAVVNAAVPTEMAVDLGSVVKLMVLDTLSGRSPLYRLESFAAALDTGLLLGREVRAGAFNDTTLGRALDAIYACGSEQLFSQIALAAAAAFPAEVDMRHLHFDTTSVSVWGEYAARAADAPEELRVTYGYSKDQRPDLKQFLVQMLCCQRNIPLLGGCADGNASDTTINNAVLTRLSAYMARHGLAAGAFVYIADSALVTARNLEAIGGNLFITRLPFTYGEAERVVSEALQGGAWTAAPQPAPTNASRKAAAYRVREAAVSIGGAQLPGHRGPLGRQRQAPAEEARASAQRIAGAGRGDPERGREDRVLLLRGRRGRRREAARRCLALPLLRVRGQRAADLRAGQAAEERRAPGSEDQVRARGKSGRALDRGRAAQGGGRLLRASDQRPGRR